MIERIKATLVQFIAASHIVGPDLSDGIESMRRANAGGWKTTLSLWESRKKSSEQVAEQYCTAVEAISSLQQDSKFSIKPAALQFNVTLFKEVIQTAKRLGVHLQFDAEHPQYASRSFSLFERGCCEYEKIGYTLPARWKRSAADAEKIIAMQVAVRLVKGQWNDPEILCKNVEHHFQRLANKFIGKRNTVIVATHDAPLARRVLKVLIDSQTPCELEQMFGLPFIKSTKSEIDAVARRMYIPYGHPYLPYNYSFAIERPRIVGWLVRDCFIRSERKKGLLYRPYYESSQRVTLDKFTENQLPMTAITAEGKQ